MSATGRCEPDGDSGDERNVQLGEPSYVVMYNFDTRMLLIYMCQDITVIANDSGVL